MLPTRINVLPPDKQVHLQRMIRSEFIRSTLALLIIVCAIVGMAFVGSRAVLQSYFSDLADTLNAVTVNSKDKNALIGQANSRIDLAERVIATYYYWPAFVTELYNAIPDSVILSKVIIDKPEGVATVSGTSATRDGLIQLGSALRALPMVDSVDIPISQLTEQEDISFTLRMRISL